MSLEEQGGAAVGKKPSVGLWGKKAVILSGRLCVDMYRLGRSLARALVVGWLD
jgi:hypothetical protein